VGVLVCGAGLIEALPPKLVDESVLAVAVATVAVPVCVAGCAARTARPKAAKAVTATAPIE